MLLISGVMIIALRGPPHLKSIMLHECSLNPKICIMQQLLNKTHLPSCLQQVWVKRLSSAPSILDIHSFNGSNIPWSRWSVPVGLQPSSGRHLSPVFLSSQWPPLPGCLSGCQVPTSSLQKPVGCRSPQPAGQPPVECASLLPVGARACRKWSPLSDSHVLVAASKAMLVNGICWCSADVAPCIFCSLHQNYFIFTFTIVPQNTCSQ